MELNEKTLKLLEENLKESSDEKIERIKLLIENNSEVSDELKEAFLKVIADFMAARAAEAEKAEEATEEAEETPEAEDSTPADLVTALKVAGMKEYIESLTKEAHALGYAEASALSSLEKTDEPASEEVEVSSEDNEKVETPDEDVKKVLIDSIVQSATALRKPEIDLENVNESQDKYREELASKDHEDLKSIYKALAKDMVDSFVNAPTESLENESISEDSPEGLDKKEDAENKSEAYTILKSYFYSKKDNK